MSGFNPAWLDLREPADHRARNAETLAACAAHFSRREAVRLVDLGCGSGSNLRALAPRLPTRQDWRLVDNDPGLLAAARERLARWADRSSTTADGMRFEYAGKRIDVAFVEADLARDPAALIGDADLVAAAALFDLVSEDWMTRFVGALAAAATPLYAALTYNGTERWTPPDARDAAMLAAFHAHQARDKGFGPAAGPRAASILSRLLAARDCRLCAGASDWRLTRRDAALIAALAEGVAAACAETELVAADEIAGWRAARAQAEVVVGHTDLFAAPA